MSRKSPFLSSLLLFFLLFIILFFFPSVSALADSSQQKVYDMGELLTDEEETSLEQLCRKIGDKRKIDIVILTLNDPEITDSLSYLNNFYQKNKFGFNKELGDTVLISVDMVNRDIYIRGHGICETYINDNRANKIAEKSSSYFTEKQYAEGFTVFINTIDRYMGISPRFNPDSFLLKWYVQLAIALIIGGTVTAVMAANSHSGCTTTSKTYLSAADANFSLQRDDFIRTTTTRVKKPEVSSNGNSSSGGGGSSSSGGGSTGHAKF